MGWQNQKIDNKAELENLCKDPELSETRHFDLAMGIFSVLFVSPSPISLNHLRTTMNIPKDAFDSAMDTLKTILCKYTPLILQEFDRYICLKTKPEFADYVKTFTDVRGQKIKLSEEALLTLTIIAYSQPMQKSAIDKIRGVDSEKTLETLKRYGLVEPTGRLDNIGAPILYITTSRFLEHFGLKSISELPIPSTQNNTPIRLFGAE